MSTYQNPTIAIIDSGIGGVSVLRQLIATYSVGNYIYFADNLFMPYGNKTKSWLKKRTEHIISFLKKEYHAKYIIIACNTASTAISTNSNNVLQMLFNDNYTYLATKLTKRNLKDFNVIADNSLAKQIEKHIFNKKILDRTIKRHVKIHKLNELKEYVLGCTHYELVQDIFAKHCANSNVIKNSQFLLDNISFNFQSQDLNVVIMLSKKDIELENKILKILRS